MGTFCYSCIQVYHCTTKFRAINIFKKKKEEEEEEEEAKCAFVIQFSCFVAH